MKIVLSDIQFIELLQRRDIPEDFNLLGYDMIIADLVFRRLSAGAQNNIISSNTIQVVRFDPNQLNDSLFFKSEGELHIADCVSLWYCKKWKLQMATEEAIIKKIAEKNNIQVVSIYEIYNQIIKMDTG